MLAKQEDIIRVLYSRFRAVSGYVRDKIPLIYDIALLDTILDKAVTVEKIDEIELQIDEIELENEDS